MKTAGNAGPLMALAKLSVLHLLPALYRPVLIPVAVYTEVVTRGIARGHLDAHAVDLAVRAGDLTVVPLTEADLPESVRSLPLAAGERHAIALALREAADWVLLDELAARRHARRIGLQPKGTLGVIVATHRGGLPAREECSAVLEAMRARPDIWISDALIQRAQSELW